MEVQMKVMRNLVASAAIGVSLIAAPLASVAAPTDTTFGGETVVALAGSFLAALSSLGVAPGAIGPARIEAYKGTTYAAFPITTGQIDLGTVQGEIDHSGGLSLTAGSTVVELTAFAIDLYSGASPVLTGLVTVNGSFVGRIPLFDLSLASATIDDKKYFLEVGDVALTLDPVAAGALSSPGVFNTAVPAGLAVGTATVRAHLTNKRHW
jgi:hypothetical protein